MTPEKYNEAIFEMRLELMTKTRTRFLLGGKKVSISFDPDTMAYVISNDESSVSIPLELSSFLASNLCQLDHTAVLLGLLKDDEE